MFPFSQFKVLNKKLDALNANVNTKIGLVMAKIDELKEAVQAVADGAAEAQSELAADAAQIKDLTDKLAALPPASSGTSDADVDAVVSQLKSIADGLPKKVQPVVDASSSASTAAASA